MNLDIKFIVASLILLSSIIPLYIYREKIISIVYTKGSIKEFINDIKLHMNKYHPFIPINYAIIKKSENEKDIKVRQTIIVENIITQFINYDYEKMTQGTVSKDKLWSGYEKNSVSSTQKPGDWKARRELAWNRDEKRCNRCGQTIELNDSNINFVKNIEDGGGYNVENLLVLCSDCNKVINIEDIKPSSLEVQDRLMFYVQS
ncbi:MAG: HNH endonuclease [Campylobacterota bacterium]